MSPDTSSISISGREQSPNVGYLLGPCAQPVHDFVVLWLPEVCVVKGEAKLVVARVKTTHETTCVATKP